jgi:hypothetical protein
MSLQRACLGLLHQHEGAGLDEGLAGGLVRGSQAVDVHPAG